MNIFTLLNNFYLNTVNFSSKAGKMKTFKVIIILFCLTALFTVSNFIYGKKKSFIKYSKRISYNKQTAEIYPVDIIKEKYIKSRSILSYYKFYIKNNKCFKIEYISNAKINHYKIIEYKNGMINSIKDYNNKKKIVSSTRFFFRKNKTVYRSIIKFVTYSRYIIRLHDIYGNVIQTINEPW